MKPIPAGKGKAASDETFLLVWQGIELFLMVAFIAVTFLMYAFSGDKDIPAIWSVLWKVMVVKVIVLFFFHKKKRWAVIFNLVQNAGVLLFIMYAVYYTLLKGDTGHLAALLTMTALILLAGVFYIFLIKKFFIYYKFLK